MKEERGRRKKSKGREKITGRKSGRGESRVCGKPPWPIQLPRWHRSRPISCCPTEACALVHRQVSGGPQSDHESCPTSVVMCSGRVALLFGVPNFDVIHSANLCTSACVSVRAGSVSGSVQARPSRGFEFDCR